MCDLLACQNRSEYKWEHPKVSIIVLNYNGKKYLKNCFESLKKQTYPNYEVIMVDNASTDGSVSYVQKCFPWVRVIQNSTNIGYAKANNEAEKEASGEYLLFLNMDTWVKPDLLNVLVSTVISNPKIGVCACTQLSYDGKQRLSTGLTTDLFAYPIKPNKQKQILYSDGASLFVKRLVFRQIGGFDPAYFMYGEDVDLCWRVLLSGHDVVATGSAIVGHKSSGTIIQSGKIYQTNKLRRYMAERNSIRTVLKNYSAHTLIYILPLRAVITFLQIVFFFLIRQHTFANAEIRAVVWNLRKLKETFALRCAVQRTRKISDRTITRRMSKLLGIAKSFAAIRQGSLGINWKDERRACYTRTVPYNEEIYRLVEPGWRVLDVGCGEGYLGERLKVDKNCVVVGVEIDEGKARQARARLDDIIISDVEVMDDLTCYRDFDAIILADVLEHLRYPKQTLQGLSMYLKNQGCLLVSVPNIANWMIRLKLLFGKFNYEESGILDKSHLHFFTLSTIKEFLEEAGFEVIYIGSYNRLLKKLGKAWKSLFAHQLILKARKKRIVHKISS